VGGWMQFLKRLAVCQRCFKEEDGFRLEHTCFQAIFSYFLVGELCMRRRFRICKNLMGNQNVGRF